MGRATTSFCVVAVMATASRIMLGSHPTPAATNLVQDHLIKAMPDIGIAGNATWQQAPLLGVDLELDPTPARSTKAARLASIRVQTQWINGLAKPMVPAPLWNALPSVLQSWLRNWVFSICIYFGLGFAWSYYIYHVFGTDLFPSGNVPTWTDIVEQMQVSFVALPMYSMLPALTEAMCERGWTLTYGNISDVGVPRYLAYLALYMFFVEFGVYWMHRKLHEIPQGYKYLHAVHHKYNKANSMSPFAGLAFHAIDGILQAVPYTLTLFIVPMHFFTHEVLLFMTAFWTANIHDNVHGNVVPIMGAGWHTIHHTLYKFNYGHYFVFMDWFFGTLLSPEELEAKDASRRAASAERRAAAAVAGTPSAAAVVKAQLAPSIAGDALRQRPGGLVSAAS